MKWYLFIVTNSLEFLNLYHIALFMQWGCIVAFVRPHLKPILYIYTNRKYMNAHIFMFHNKGTQTLRGDGASRYSSNFSSSKYIAKSYRVTGYRVTQVLVNNINQELYIDSKIFFL